MVKNSHFLVFSLDDKHFALPLDTVQWVVQAVEITILRGVPAIVRGIINYKGTILPVFDIRPRFHLPQREIQPDDQFIIVDTAGRTIALLVDTVVDNIEISSREMIPPAGILDETLFLDGILKMEDGIMLIPDLNNILTQPEDQALEKAMERAAK